MTKIKQPGKCAIKVYKKYVPKNITLKQFRQMVDQDSTLLDSIGGKFSTVDIELSSGLKKYTKKKISADSFRSMLKDTISQDTMQEVALTYAQIYEKIICSDDSILQGAWTFEILDKEQKQDLALKIINGMNKYLNIDKNISFKYSDKALYNTNTDVNNVLHLVNKVVKLFLPSISMSARYKGYYDEKNKGDKKIQIVLSPKTHFEDFIQTLSHEYGHFIDCNYPELGMLGAQITAYGGLIYSKKGKNYKENPTEVSSFKLGDVIRKRITQLLKEQAHKKPEYYAKTMNTVISGLKMKLAAQTLQEENARKEYMKLRSEMRSERYPDFYSLPEAQRAKIWEKIDKSPRLINYKKVKQKYQELVSQIFEQRYLDFYKLSHEQKEQILQEIDKEPRVSKYKNMILEYKALREKLRKERFPGYFELTSDQKEKVKKEIENIPRVKRALKKWQRLIDQNRQNPYRNYLVEYEMRLEEVAFWNKNINIQKYQNTIESNGK